MKNIYDNQPANYPRIKTDTFFADYSNTYKYSGFIDKAFKYIEEFQLLRPDLWARFVQQFREDADYEAGWRGEYWGKMMRGACFVYSYTKNPELYNMLCDTVEEIMTTADENGRISSYAVNHEFDGWDMWGRKYVLLGMQYFLEICDDEDLKKRVIKSMCGQVDYLIEKIGKPEDGKKLITTCTRHWRGLNASSILEAIVRLYSHTKEQKYLDFATYIVDCGGTDVENFFELAYKDEMYPYQYPVTKAYEMTSCFEGLLEYYRIMGNEKHKIAVINFANKILESDFTVIGCCGCTHELFDHSTVRQANTTNPIIMQETCVTVTLMKFFYQVHLLTGCPKYADAFEISLYNAYLGSINTERVIEPTIKENHPDWAIEPLPFDSYSPLTAGTRGNGIGGLKLMSDNHYYGCCACIGAAGIGLVPKMQLLTTEKGFALNLYVNGEINSKTPTDKNIVFDIKTNYPAEGTVAIALNMDESESFELKLRNPYWSKTTAITINGDSADVNEGYVVIEREWKNGDVVEITLDMRTEAIYPIPYGSEILMNKCIWGRNMIIPAFDREDPTAKNHIALRRGPVMFAQENRLGYSVDDPIEVKVNKDGYVDIKEDSGNVPYEYIVKAEIPLTDGTFMTVTDYSSAGKLWTEESKMAVWMLTKGE
mgnify:CR=1 FL=1